MRVPAREEEEGRRRWRFGRSCEWGGARRGRQKNGVVSGHKKKENPRQRDKTRQTGTVTGLRKLDEVEIDRSHTHTQGERRFHEGENTRGGPAFARLANNL